MTHSDLFFLILLATVAVTRIWLYSRPMGSPVIRGFRVHHYMYGLALVVIGIIAHSVIPYGIGFGLIIDEVPLVLFKPTASWDEYESKKSFTALLVVLLFVFMFRAAIAPIF